MTDDDIWMLEERLWLEPGVYETNLDPACLMAFPRVGVLSAAEVRESIENAPRWAAVTMTQRSLGRAGDDLVVLGYKAEGNREGAPPYRCFCTSTYRQDRGSWKLVQHQQTMAD